MPYLVRGNAKQLASLFDKEWLFEEVGTPAGEMIEADLAKSSFLGGPQDAEHHVKAWRDAAQSRVYTQGDMSAANLFFFLDKNYLFKKENEDYLDYQNNYVALSFSYVNEHKELCGLSIHYRKDNPSQWLMASAKNTSSALEARELSLLSSFDLQPFFAESNPEKIAVEVVDKLHNPLIEQLGSLLVKGLLAQSLLGDKDEINGKILRIAHLFRLINLNEQGLVSDPINVQALDPALLFAENPTLDLITHYNLRISARLLVDCLADNSGLRKEIESLKLTDNPAVNACILRLTIHFYEQGMLNEYRDLVQTQLIDKTRAGTIWNDEQIQLAAVLMQKKYPPELVQQILSKKAYYASVKELFHMGLTDIPAYFLNPDKVRELEFIDKVGQTDLKQFCLLFWVKGQLSYSEYQTIIKAGETYPLLAETLIALDKTGEISIKELKALALDPQKHLQQSIIHHFGNDYSVNRITLNKLSVSELTRLNEAFVILKQKTTVGPEAFDVAARDNEQGKLLRLFLPSFNTIYKQAYRDSLVDLLYEGIQKGPISLDKKIAQLSDKRLQLFAMDLRNRVICAKQMQKLHLNDELVTLAASAQSNEAKRFREIILKVEEACKKINTRLDVNANEKQRKAWQNAEKEYRQVLYGLAYQTLKDPNYNYGPILEKAQQKMLDIVDPEVKSWLQKALIVVANVFIYALTAGYANQAKEKRIGNFWFFNHTDSGDELRHLEGEIKSQFRGPK
ncbi:hypothetical protein [Legionella sp. km772]|uniref:hypothetical protein n=1 Tax=Legionella sp. km772 TaxID=2498111 RepID=UPI000F8EFC09|nr:hypothetical protein [Legionella sp. km772]RUR11665.1 hypothetical protein ELY15_06795 [Legionella sp. km772]